MKKHSILIATLFASLLTACGGGSSSSSKDNNPNPDNNSEPGDNTEPNNNSVSALVVEQMYTSVAAINDAQANISLTKSSGQFVPILTRLNSNEEQTIVSHGPISVTAVCTSSGGLQVNIVSTMEGTLLEEASGYMPVNDVYTWTSLSGAGFEVVPEADRGSVLAPSGHFIMMGGENMMVATDVQGADCLISGIITLAQGNASPEFEVPDLR